MSGSEGDRSAAALARLGFSAGQVAIEFGYDDDVDLDFREQAEGVLTAALEDEDYDGIVDAVVLWWRDGDGDLADDLVDSFATLEDGGFIVLLTPARHRPDRVAADVVQEACATSGLTASGAVPVGEDWVAQRLVGRR